MGKFSLNKLPKEKRVQMLAEFYDVINSLKNRKEVRLFFRDLLTPDEITMLMRRLEVATLLLGGFTYEQISELLGVGRGKVNNVQKTLIRRGEGYKIAVKRLLGSRKAKLKRLRKIEKNRQSIFARMKEKYPLYFLLFNLIDEMGEFLAGERIKDKEALLITPSSKRNRK